MSGAVQAVGRRLGQRRQLERTGRIHEDVRRAARPRMRPIGERGDRACIRQVGVDRRTTHGRGRRGERVPCARDEGDARACSRQPFGDRAADAARRAGDQGRPAPQRSLR
jgi:hypothetical protein